MMRPLHMKKVILGIFALLFCINSYAQTTIQMEDVGGIYKIPCTVNGLKLKMFFDPGASNVCISESVALMMLENDYLSVDDILGTTQGRVADGRIVDHTVIVLKEIIIGEKKLNNIEAVVTRGQDVPLLFGQSALRRLGRYSISGDKLIIASSKNMNDTKPTEKERAQLLDEANTAYKEGAYYVAIGKYKILYENNQLTIYDIYRYADCYYSVTKYEEALELFLLTLKDIESDFPDTKAPLYAKIATCFSSSGIDDCETAIPYFELAKYYAEQWSENQKNYHNLQLSCLERIGNYQEASRIRLQYIRKYLSYKSYTITDCWDNHCSDEFLSELLFDLACGTYNYYLTTKSSTDLIRFREYLVIAAAWGQKTARIRCNNLGLDYLTKPGKDINLGD